MNQRLVRIVFELDSSAWHGNATERLWAEQIGTGRYRLRNSPFFAFDVSNEDIVFGVERDGQVFSAGVSIRGGHSTYRLRLKGVRLGDVAFTAHWKPLEKLSCSFEEGEVLAVDVPAKADIHAVYESLAAGESAGVWEFEEGHCGHPTTRS